MRHVEDAEVRPMVAALGRWGAVETDELLAWREKRCWSTVKAEDVSVT